MSVLILDISVRQLGTFVRVDAQFRIIDIWDPIQWNYMVRM